MDEALFEKVMNFYAAAPVVLDKLEWRDGDVMDPELLEEYMQGCSHCIHAAAMVSFHPKDREAMMQVNIEGTANVVNACSAIPGLKLLHVSSVAALGRTDKSGFIDEDEVWKDSPHNTNYALSKYLAEMEVWRGIEEGLDAVIVNPTIILGIGSTKRSSGTIFGAVANGLKFYTDGDAAVTDVRDVSRMSLGLLFSGNSAQRYILCGTMVPYRELFSEIAARMSKSAPSIYASPFLLQVAWRLAWLKDLLFGTRSPITKETARSSVSAYVYKSNKVLGEVAQGFYPLDESLDYLTPFFVD